MNGKLNKEESKEYRLWGGMNGEIILSKSWGDVIVHATMGRRGAQDKTMLFSMLEHKVPNAEITLAGELNAPGIVVYWRVGHSRQSGKLNVVLARKCERESKFDNWVSLFTSYPGNAENPADAGSAVQKINKLVRCINS